MATALDIITQSLRKMAIYAPNETPTDADVEQGLTCLNDMLDMWSNESLSCYAITEQSGTLVPGVSQYSIGPGGVFNMTRPLRILDGPGAAYSQDVNGNNYQISVIPQDEWNLIGNRTSIMQSDFPLNLFYDPQFPIGFINVWPQPNQGLTMFWDSYLQLTDFSVLTSTVNLPPGYKKALQDNLCVEMWSYFKSGEPTGKIMRDAMESKGIIKRTNVRPNRAIYDPALVTKANSTYNVYTDGYTSSSS